MSVVLKWFTIALSVSVAVDAAYKPQTPRLSTPWTSKVSLTDPLPEYPRPQLARNDWQSLNGQWQFAAAANISNPPTGKTLAETILVPFPIEAPLSGIKRHEKNSFYRRTFTVPSSWVGRNIQLNFGAVNWRALVWVNGKQVGTHSGAYDPFSFDITSALKNGTNELIVGVYSPVNSAESIPIGKQLLNPSGIRYSAASGIWQTVWLEPTNAARITRLDPTPDVPSGVLKLDVQTVGASGQTVTAVILDGKTTIAKATAKVGKTLKLSVPNARLWSPDDPFLYDLRVSLSSGDDVAGYFGFRSISKAVVNGFLRSVLNGRFVFQLGLLDQGYWPDGIYTAPTDEALRWDLVKQKELGYNMVRKHMKVEPARWYYYADKLGLLVIQDMPSMRKGSDADHKNFEDELRRMIDHLRGITSIVQWVPFNEGWGEYDEKRITDLTKSLDPTRLVTGNSGSNCCGRDPGNGDIVDSHIYVGPGKTRLPSDTRISQLGEFGGLGMIAKGHRWMPDKGFGYEMSPDGVTLTRRYAQAVCTLQGVIWGRGLSSAVYTTLTDVENEANGLWSYDRQMFKGNFDQMKAANAAVLNGVAWLRPDKLISLGAGDRYIRSQNSSAVVSAASDARSRQETTFRVRAGLASGDCFSFEARTSPGYYLRHDSSAVRLAKLADTKAFNSDATFCLRTGHTVAGVSFEAFSARGKFLRHSNSVVTVAAKAGAETTWQVASPNWRSGADIKTGSRVSLRVATPGQADRFIRHQGQGKGVVTARVTSGSDAGTKQDATFIARAGLADPSCYSFESVNQPGKFLRHSKFRVMLAAKDKSDPDGFARSATFCAEKGMSDAFAVSLQSFNVAGHKIRRVNGEVWIALAHGPHEHDGHADSFKADGTFRVAAAWA